MTIRRAHSKQNFPSTVCKILFDEGDIRVYSFYSKYIFISKNAHDYFLTVGGRRNEVYEDLLYMDIEDIDLEDLTMENIKIYLAFI